MERRKRRALQISGVAVALGLSLWGASKGITYNTRRSDEAVDAISDLRDPSPFRAALVGHLDKIHLSLNGYLRTRDQTLVQQVAQSETDFEHSVPEFERQNPKLLPAAAGREILEDYRIFKDSLGHLLEI